MAEPFEADFAAFKAYCETHPNWPGNTPLGWFASGRESQRADSALVALITSADSMLSYIRHRGQTIDGKIAGVIEPSEADQLIARLRANGLNP